VSPRAKAACLALLQKSGIAGPVRIGYIELRDIANMKVIAQLCPDI